MPLKKVEGEQRFWKEDADRINQLSAKAATMGIAVQVVDSPPPALNPDGSLRQPNENSLDEFSEFVANCGGKGGKPGKCVLPKNPKKAKIYDVAKHLHSTGHTLALAPYDLVRKQAQYDVKHPDGTVKRMTSDEVKHLAYGKGKGKK